jgi:hypothetical protein
MATGNFAPLEASRWLCLTLGLLGCQNDVYTIAGNRGSATLAVPARNVFPQVADAMQLHCGTLDCHGQVGRNMRLYGQFGLRLDPKGDPLGQVTSNAEYDACYASIAALEPEAISDVVQRIAPPDTLTMVRKPRGIEEHKGGQVVVEGDALDRCMVGWLVGAFDANPCNTVVQTPRPEPDAGP